MTIQEAEHEVAFIEGITNNAAHATKLEDKLYEKFVRHVAKEGDGDLKKLAQTILKTKDLDFKRTR